MFTTDDIISCYTWDDAINDGIFVEVTEQAKQLGFKFPTAVTSNLFHLHLEHEDKTDMNIQSLLRTLRDYIRNGMADGSYAMFQFDNIQGDTINLMAVIEGRSPENPEPIMTIMLPEDR